LAESARLDVVDMDRDGALVGIKAKT